MDELLNLDSVGQYNALRGQLTLHPLVSVIDFSQAAPARPARMRFGFYAVFLKEVKCGDIRYGRNFYDYQEGTLVFVAPGQVTGFNYSGEPYRPRGWALLFHPDLIRGTSLGRRMKEYTFFSYEVNEALHLSEQERRTVVDCLHNIETELRRGVDRHSRTLIVTNIELLLNYCVRFYDRQFITRGQVNRDVLTRFERVLDDYFLSDSPQELGLPSVRYCADRLNLSANYLGDLLKKETGKSAQEHIQLKLIDVAKEKVFDPGKTVSEIAYELGFKYPQHFSRLFKKRVGCSPQQYRSQR